MKQNAQITLKTLNKSNVWDIQENDVFRLLIRAEKDADLRDNIKHYIDIFRSAFNIEEVKVDRPEVTRKYEDRGFKVAQVGAETEKTIYAIKKKPIQRVTDLTYENIQHISASKLIEVLSRNFGGGWESLPQSIQDIIESGFDISTTTLPANRLKKPGGMYEKKVADGYEVLEIPKGTWTEAIFAKEKPHVEHQHTSFKIDESKPEPESEDEDLPEDKYDSQDDDDDDDAFDDEKLTEESYRTTFETSPEDLEKLGEEVEADDDYSE